MRLVQDLPEIFEEFGEKRRQAFLEIKEYKDKGIPVVGMYCAYFPTELAMAVGAIPVGLCSFSNETVMSAERELPKSMCPLVKSSYGFAVEDKCPFFHFADLVIGETTCDGKKKMYELMAEFKPVFVMELPNSQSERALGFWEQEVVRTKEFLEEFFQVVITDQMIRDAVHLSNRIRLSLKNLCEVMKLDPAPVLGEDIQKMITGSKYRFDFKTTPEVVDAVTARIMEEYRQGKMLGHRPRILVTGCPIGGDSMKVIHEIENNGGVVVAVENCSGVKTLDRMVDETQEDVYAAIAKRYLSTGCSIMTPNDNRIELLGRIIDEYRVDGVVEMILTGCHATGAESIYIRKFVNDEKKLPYMAIDTDYSSADVAQISTRIAAFLEMIQSEKDGGDQIDINYCYKIILSGITGGRPISAVLEEIGDYTGVEVSVCTREEADKVPPEPGIRMAEKELQGGKGTILARIPAGKSMSKIVEIMDILAKSFELEMKSVGQEDLETEICHPDFLWIVASDDHTLDGLCGRFSKEGKPGAKLLKRCDQSVLLSCVSGKTGRERLIGLCREYMEGQEGILLIGNGFREERHKEKNRLLQLEALKIAQKSRTRGGVRCMEDYYYELAVSLAGRKLGKSSFHLAELDRIRREDEEKGKNLYETLYAYLKLRRNVANTAASLKIHRNTLLTRIARINELIHLDEKDGAECEKLFLAMETEKLV